MALLLIIFTVLANIAIAVVVYNNNKKSISNKLLSALAINLAAWSVFTYIALQPNNEITRLFWVRFVMFITSPLGPLIYLLAKAFPQPQIQLKKTEVIALISLTSLSLLLALSPFMFVDLRNTADGMFSLTPGFGIIAYALNLFIFMGLGFIYLAKRLKRSTGLVRKQLMYFVFGVVLSFSLIAITNFIAVVIFATTQLTFIGPPLTLIMVLLISYAMLKHRLLEIRALVARVTAYSFLMLGILVIVIASTFFASQYLTSGYNLAIFSSTITILISLSFHSLRLLVDKLTNKIFFRQPYSSEKLINSLSDTVRSTLTLKTLTRNTLEALIETMHITKGAYIITQPHQNPVVIQQGYGEMLTVDVETLTQLSKACKNQLIAYEETQDSKTKELLRNIGAAIVIPLRVKSISHGVLMLGDKESGEIFSQQDLGVLEIFMPQISLALQNAKSFEEISRFNITLKDEVESATKSLKKANRNLRHLDKLKDEFVYIATHELKNPVTAMRGYLSLINEGLYGEVPKKLKDPLTQLNASNQQLVTLVNDLLQIARSEAKSITIHTETVDVCSIIEAVLGSLKPLADQKQIKLIHHCLTKQLLVRADPDKLREIFNNLVSNAIKYSEKGTISLYHLIEQGMVVTHVKDQGFGIADKDQKKLFSRFYRVEEQVAKGIPGTGLGLFIVKQLIEKMGGRIWFTSKPGSGTTFSFSLPQG